MSCLGSSVPSTQDVFVPLVQGDTEGSLQDEFDGSVLSNSALVAGNVRTLLYQVVLEKAAFRVIEKEPQHVSIHRSSKSPR